MEFKPVDNQHDHIYEKHVTVHVVRPLRHFEASQRRSLNFQLSIFPLVSDAAGSDSAKLTKHWLIKRQNGKSPPRAASPQPRYRDKHTNARLRLQWNMSVGFSEWSCCFWLPIARLTAALVTVLPDCWSVPDPCICCCLAMPPSNN